MVKIVVYSLYGCENCETLKKWLRKRGFKFKNIELMDVMDDLVEKGIYFLPALEVDGIMYREVEYFFGTNLVEAKLLKLLKENGC